MDRFVVVVVLCLVVLLAPLPQAWAAVETITATGEYVMGEDETISVAKERALNDAMRNAAEQAGVYVESYSQIHDMQLAREDITAISAAVLEIVDKQFGTPVIRQEQNGLFTQVTVQITAKVDTDNIAKQQQAFAERRELKAEYNKVYDLYTASEAEVARLKQQLSQVQNTNERQAIAAEINHNETGFTALQWIDQGLKLIDKRNYTSAINAFNRAIALEPHNIQAHYDCALMYFYKNAYDRALTEANTVLSLDGAAVDAYYLRSRIYYALGQADEALADVDAVLAQRPADTAAYLLRGQVYARKGQHGQALDDFNAALGLDPQLYQAYTARAGIYAAEDEMSLALADCDEALRLHPNDADARFIRALSYAQRGLTDEALAGFTGLLKENRRNGRVYIARGGVYEQLGNWRAALADYRQGRAYIAAGGDKSLAAAADEGIKRTTARLAAAAQP